ncbi:hypothetical protein RFF05_11590 [Bengtsoniella intestinalis]|uniref:hypothetical protein n=1 Tax=Bengtsoniella intestinalis TaxID=3073143 RepID=UPI00391FC486
MKKSMHIQVDNNHFYGTAVEILGQMRGLQFDPTEYPDDETYLWQLQANYIRFVGKECPIPKGDLETQAAAMFRRLEGIGALRFVEDADEIQ